jgi:hypothetical protein
MMSVQIAVRASNYGAVRTAYCLLPGRNEGPTKPNLCLSEITLEMQNTVLEGEEIIQQSQWLIAKSNRLQALIDELRNGGFGRAKQLGIRGGEN